MSFKGKTNKGRYNERNMTQDHFNCLSLKIQLRKRFLNKYNEPFKLIEAFAGKEELYKKIYSKYHIQKRFCLDIEPLASHILKADANTFPINKSFDYDVYDLDHHKLEVLQTFKNWLPAIKKDCTVFLTFGIMSFVRKTTVKEKTVLFNGGDNKLKLNYQMSYNVPENYINAAAKYHGYKVENLIKVRYKNIVSYYGFNLVKI